MDARLTRPLGLALLSGVVFAVALVIAGVTGSITVDALANLVALVAVVVGLGALAWLAWRLLRSGS